MMDISAVVFQCTTFSTQAGCPIVTTYYWALVHAWRQPITSPHTMFQFHVHHWIDKSSLRISLVLLVSLQQDQATLFLNSRCANVDAKKKPKAKLCADHLADVNEFPAIAWLVLALITTNQKDKLQKILDHGILPQIFHSNELIALHTYGYRAIWKQILELQHVLWWNCLYRICVLLADILELPENLEGPDKLQALGSPNLLVSMAAQDFS